MKKWIINLILIGLAVGFTACNHDDDEMCVVLRFDDFCLNNEYVSCRPNNEGATKGVIVRQTIVEIGGVDYFCNDNNQLQARLTCENSVFKENQQSLIFTNTDILECVGKEIVKVTDKYNSYCQGNSRVYFDSELNRFTATDCTKEGKICEQLLKTDVVQAVCIDRTNVSEGCSSSTAYGTCQGNSLVICSNKVASKGKTLVIDCESVSPNHVCTLVEKDSYGYDCALNCGEYNYVQITDFGYCYKNNLYYCQQNAKTYSEVSCAGLSKKCGFNDKYYDCI